MFKRALALVFLLTLSTTAFAQIPIRQTQAEITAGSLQLAANTYRIVINTDTDELYIAKGTGTGSTYILTSGSGSTIQVLNDAALRTETTTLGQTVWVEGNTAAADGGEGFFVDIGLVSSFPGVVDDGGYHIFSTGNTRLMRRAGTVKPEHYAAVAYDTRAAAHAGASDSIAHLDAMEAARQDWDAQLEFGNKYYYAASTWEIQNWGCDLKNVRLVFPGTGQITGIRLVDADAGKELSVKPKYRNITLLKGSVATSSDWQTYGYADTMVDAESPAAVQTWAETDIGFEVLAQSSTLLERIECQNFAIGLCQNTEDSITGTPYNVWNKTKGLMTNGCRIAELVRCEGIDTGNNGGWINEYHTEHARTNIGIANESSYGFVMLSDPAKVTAGTAYVPSGISVTTGSHEGSHGAGQETVPLCVLNARSLKYYGRNDGPNLTFRVADQDPTLIQGNYDIEIELTSMWESTQFDVDGAAVNITGPGVIQQRSTIVDASELNSIIHTYTENEVTAQSRQIAFEDINETTAPLVGSWRLLTNMNGDGTIDNMTNIRIGSLLPGDTLRGGIGSHISLGNTLLGGSVIVNVHTGNGEAQLGAICYDNTGTVISALPAEGWLVRDVPTGQGTFMGNWTFASSKSLSVKSIEDRAKRMMFHPDVESVFLFVYGDELAGFTIESQNLPGSRVIPVKETDLRQSSVEPVLGVFEGPIRTFDSTNATTGWRYNQAGQNYALDGTWMTSTTVRRGGRYATASDELWVPVGGSFGIGQGSDTVTCGTNTPDGQASPFTDDAGVIWRQLTGHSFTGNVATFETIGSSASSRKGEADDLGALLGTNVINWDAGSYDNKNVDVTGAVDLSGTPTREGIYGLTINMDGVGGHTTTLSLTNPVGTVPTIDTTANAVTNITFFWDGTNSVVLNQGSGSVVVGASAIADGAAGIVPQPLEDQEDWVLEGDGTFQPSQTRNLNATLSSFLQWDNEDYDRISVVVDAAGTLPDPTNLTTPSILNIGFVNISGADRIVTLPSGHTHHDASENDITTITVPNNTTVFYDVRVNVAPNDWRWVRTAEQQVTAQFTTGTDTVAANEFWIVNGAHTVNFPAGASDGDYFDIGVNGTWQTIGATLATTDTATINDVDNDNTGDTIQSTQDVIRFTYSSATDNWIASYSDVSASGLLSADPGNTAIISANDSNIYSQPLSQDVGCYLVPGEGTVFATGSNTPTGTVGNGLTDWAEYTPTTSNVVTSISIGYDNASGAGINTAIEIWQQTPATLIATSTNTFLFPNGGGTVGTLTFNNVELTAGTTYEFRVPIINQNASFRQETNAGDVEPELDWTPIGGGQDPSLIINGLVPGRAVVTTYTDGATQRYVAVDEDDHTSIVAGTMPLPATWIACAPTTVSSTVDSDVVGRLSARETASGETREVEFNAVRNIEAVVDPVNGITVAWYVGQFYTNTATGQIFRASTESADPDTAGTGSVWEAIGAETRSELGTTYTTVTTDTNDVIYMTNAAAITVTVDNSIPVGHSVTFIQGGAGTVTFAPGGGVTVNSLGGALNIAGQWGSATLHKQAANTYTLIGAIQ